MDRDHLLMARDEFSQRLQNANPAIGHSRYDSAQDTATLTAEYTRHYSQINPLLQGGKLDFRKIAERAGLKERKVREVILFRLLPGNMVQLLGRKEGICFICGKKFQDTGFQEALCLTCLRMISMTIAELYPDGWDGNDSAIAEGAPVPTESAGPEEPMVSWDQYESALQEINQYRDKYGSLTSNGEMADKTAAFDEPGEIPERSPTFAEIDPSTSANEDMSLETVTRTEPSDDVMRLLNLDDSQEEDFAFAETSREPIKHFGFQRTKPRR